jgi:hypothetical protein
MKDLFITYRVCPKSSGNRPVFDGDKEGLVRLCAKSFRIGLGSLKASMQVMLDGCPDGYIEIFNEVFSGSNVGLEIVRTPGIGNLPTFRRQLDSVPDGWKGMVCVAEDDYLYLPGAMEEAEEFLRTTMEEGFVTLYDHPDYSNGSAQHNPLTQSNLRQPLGRHGRIWRERASTCLTFMATSRAFRQGKHRMMSYSEGNHDCSMWLSLTKPRNSRPDDPDPYYRQAWKHRSFGMSDERAYPLWSPSPSLSTHVVNNMLAPGIDWIAEAGKTMGSKF